MQLIVIQIPIYQTFVEKVTPLVAFVALTVLVVRLIQKYQTHLYSPMLWYMFAVVTYCIVMAGVVYNRIRNPPFMDIQQNGRAQLISPSPRTQYVAEGIIIAFVLGGAGVLFVVLGDFVPRLSGSKKRIAFWFSAVLLFMFLTTLNSILYPPQLPSSMFSLSALLSPICHLPLPINYYFYDLMRHLPHEVWISSISVKLAIFLILDQLKYYMHVHIFIITT
jgi:hypothetical protein